ncbi:MOSC domain-containing protein [Mycena indigotica]|uniref:MOSC domain-containing protein n=1 Tax=Mycena indigotica TaxID=2126181 RepID=A0A8H6RZG3_9AGAR|nr:MOSC domain-containing protein [Mycena indigotica]KAF7289783.1 MOSC domain-containing protein [Mycena indigotica]
MTTSTSVFGAPLLRPLVLLAVGAASVYVVSEGWARRKRWLRAFSSGLRRLAAPDTVHGTDLRVARIMIYPIKSCAGIELESSTYDREGFEFDRQWMVVDVEKNKQLSARDNRGIKLVRVFPSIHRDPSSPDGGVLTVSFPDSPDTPSFSVPLRPTPETLSSWEIHAGFDLWGHAGAGYVAQSSDNDALSTPSEILSAYIGRPVLFVTTHGSLARRPTEQIGWAPDDLGYAGGSTVRYPDATPFLLVSTASLVDAEAHVHALARGEYEQKVAGCKPDEPRPRVDAWAARDAKRLLIERFRPNVVVEGVEEAYGEDDWQEIRAPDGRSFLLPMRCPRCMFPNVDTDSGERDPQMPNNAMMQYRRVEAAVPAKYCFGMYMIPVQDSGVLSVGDPLVVTRSAINPRLAM